MQIFKDYFINSLLKGSHQVKMKSISLINKAFRNTSHQDSITSLANAHKFRKRITKIKYLALKDLKLWKIEIKLKGLLNKK